MVFSLRNRPARRLNAGRPVSEPRAHAEEILSAGECLGGRSQSEERVVLDGAFPEMFARALMQQTKHKRVLLFTTLDTNDTPPQVTTEGCYCLIPGHKRHTTTGNYRGLLLSDTWTQTTHHHR